MLFRAHGNAIFLGSDTLIYCFSGHHPPTCTPSHKIWPQDYALQAFLQKVHGLLYLYVQYVEHKMDLKRDRQGSLENSNKTTSKCCGCTNTFLRKFANLRKVFCLSTTGKDAKISKHHCQLNFLHCVNVLGIGITRLSI